MQADSNRYMLQLSLPTKLSYLVRECVSSPGECESSGGGWPLEYATP